MTRRTGDRLVGGARVGVAPAALARRCHPGAVLEVLTGIGLATSAGLNAYIPLLMIGLLARYTNLITLPGPWQWLENGWVIGILVLLFAVEFVADKIPVVDHVNDVVQTVVRPTSGGLAFGAASMSQTTTVSDPGDFFSSNQWVPIAAGIVISFVVHALKATARPVINTTTAGVGAPVASTAEDLFSATMSIVAIVLPVLIIFFLAGMVGFFVMVRRRLRRRREVKAARRAEIAARQGPHDGRTMDLWG